MVNGETEFSLKEWDARARIISRQNTGSRRFSASHVRTLQEEARSFRSNFTVSSTASSPGFLLRDEIDPSTYSFTNAIKALQAKERYVNVWDSMSPEGFVLNSKWSDAERYICNPLSGEVPMECLSSKTLSQRSFRNITSRITMSAPLVYPSHYPRHIQPRAPPPPPPPPPSSTHNPAILPAQERKTAVGSTRDVGIQSTASDIVRSSSPSPASTPSIRDRNVKRCASEEAEDSLNSESKVISEEEDEEKGGGDEKTVVVVQGGMDEDDGNGDGGRVRMKRRQGGCLSWMMVMRKKKQNKEEKKKNKRMHRMLSFPRIKGC